MWRTARATSEIGLYWEKAAYEEAEHAAKFAELLGEVLTDSTKKNLEMRVEAENGATAGKFELAKRPRSWAWTPSMTPCTRWRATRPAMAVPLPACWPVTSANKPRKAQLEAEFLCLKVPGGGPAAFLPVNDTVKSNT